MNTELPPYARIASSDEPQQPSPDTPTATPGTRTSDSSSFLARPSSIPFTFWILGLLNNASYVIMLASAKSISEGGVALVFLANIVPSLSIKLSAPYWFDHVGYHARIMSSAVLMASGFGLVAVSNHHVLWELCGVALASAQCGLGEASLLALAGRCDAHLTRTTCSTQQSSESTTTSSSSSSSCITCFSSGTGLAGVFGFLWKFVWNEWLGLTLQQTLWMALLLAVFYGYVYRKFLWQEEIMPGEVLKEGVEQEGVLSNNHHLGGVRYQTAPLSMEDGDDDQEENHEHVDCSDANDERWRNEPSLLDQDDTTTTHTPPPQLVEEMSTYQRFQLVLSLYPYTIPLFLVYAAEYSLQAGTWTAIGFPVDSVEARDKFYEYSNWMYQAGVFVSRSSGTLYTAPLSVLWLMPLLQCVNVVVFWWIAASHVWYNYTLLVPCFYVGLLGGAVYVNGYTRICADMPLEHREFALSSTSVAEGLGVMVADAAGLFLQSCLYQVNGIRGAVVSCPVR